MSDYLPIKGYIYLIKLCDTKHRTIYKIGKTINFDKRIKTYNYAEILNFIISNDINDDENEIIKIFNTQCKLDKGREFFIAKDDKFVLKLFIDYFSNKINRNKDASNIISNVVIGENIENLTNVDINTSIENNKILERTCPVCSKVFNYSSRLKAHLEITVHCKKTQDEIDIFFLQFKKISNFKCNICSSEFTKNHNLKRHINNSNCKLGYNKIEKVKKIEILQKQIDNLKR